MKFFFLRSMYSLKSNVSFWMADSGQVQYFTSGFLDVFFKQFIAWKNDTTLPWQDQKPFFGEIANWSKLIVLFVTCGIVRSFYDNKFAIWLIHWSLPWIHHSKWFTVLYEYLVRNKNENCIEFNRLNERDSQTTSEFDELNKIVIHIFWYVKTEISSIRISACGTSYWAYDSMPIN